MSHEVASLQGIVPELPPRADAVVRIALSKSPKERFATMAELAEELEPSAAAAGATTDLEPRVPPVSPGDPISIAPTQRAAVAAGRPTNREATAESPLATGSPVRVRGSVATAVALALLVGVMTVSWGLSSHRRALAAPDAGARGRSAFEKMSTNPQATAAYAAGVRALHEAAMGAATKQLNRAIELDPLFAAAHLRRALVDLLTLDGFTSEFKEDLQQARNSRASLEKNAIDCSSTQLRALCPRSARSRRE